MRKKSSCKKRGHFHIAKTEANLRVTEVLFEFQITFQI